VGPRGQRGNEVGRGYRALTGRDDRSTAPARLGAWRQPRREDYRAVVRKATAGTSSAPPASGARTPAKRWRCSKRGAGITRTASISAQNGHFVWPGFAPCGFSQVGTAKLRTFAY
jgi:hypothetical protein